MCYGSFDFSDVFSDVCHPDGVHSAFHAFVSQTSPATVTRLVHVVVGQYAEYDGGEVSRPCRGVE